MTQKNKTFPSEQVTPSFTLCFLDNCKKSGDCIRHLAGQHATQGRTWGPAVYPNSLKDERCPHFKQTRIINGAWGFDKLFANIRQRDSSLLRSRLKSLLGGHGTYYRYHRGEQLLTPEQQERIVSLFHQYGYSENLHFDGYRRIYDLT